MLLPSHSCVPSCYLHHSSYFHGLITAAAAHWRVKLEKTNRNLQFDETILFVKTILN